MIDPQTFSALAEPTRRSILELLAHTRPMSAGAIYKKFKVSNSAISQHLKILNEADLVEVEKKAQLRIYRINTATLQEFEDWAHKMGETGDVRLDKVVVEEKKPGKHSHPLYRIKH